MQAQPRPQPEPNTAERIVQSLFDEEVVPELEETLVISDLEGNIAAFKIDLWILERIGRRAPALRLDGDEAVPVALSYLAPQFSWRTIPTMRELPLHEYPYPIDWLLYTTESFLNHIEEQRFEEFVTIDRDEAQVTFRRRATDFLGTRIDAIRRFQERETYQTPLWPGLSLLNIPQRAGGSRKITPGCHFSVSTNSSGLRVFWSGAYYIASNYFSHPTSPATSTLMSGIYVFGVDGGPYNTIQWDRNAIIRLPGVPHVHLNY